MKCRQGCSACCIAPSISSVIPGMGKGKSADVPCIQLLKDGGCAIFGLPSRPAVCTSLQPKREMCGDNREQALFYLARLERETTP